MRALFFGLSIFTPPSDLISPFSSLYLKHVQITLFTFGIGLFYFICYIELPQQKSPNISGTFRLQLLQYLATRQGRGINIILILQSVGLYEVPDATTIILFIMQYPLQMLNPVENFDRGYEKVNHPLDLKFELNDKVLLFFRSSSFFWFFDGLIQ